MTETQATEILRLASLWATARCRRLAVSLGRAGPFETAAGSEARVAVVERELLGFMRDVHLQTEAMRQMLTPDPEKVQIHREHATRCFYVGRRYASMDWLDDTHCNDFSLWADLVEHQAGFCLDSTVP